MNSVETRFLSECDPVDEIAHHRPNCNPNGVRAVVAMTTELMNIRRLHVGWTVFCLATLDQSHACIVPETVLTEDEMLVVWRETRWTNQKSDRSSGTTRSSTNQLDSLFDGKEGGRRLERIPSTIP